MGKKLQYQDLIEDDCAYLFLSQRQAKYDERFFRYDTFGNQYSNLSDTFGTQFLKLSDTFVN
jgi:hypothetical protein